MTAISLRSALKGLPETAQEPIVDLHFSNQLLEALGFQPEEIHPQYATGDRMVVDKAARKTIGSDIFLHTKSNPYLLVELKGRDINLSEGSAQYQKTVDQLKGYLLDSKCKSAQWGIITNSCHIQLFRKHGKVIYPATKCLSLNLDNIDEIIADIRKKIEAPTKALTVAIYNNKGGVGKTTTTVNLAAILTFLGKKVLAIDFDPNQQDLTSSLGIPLNQGDVSEALDERGDLLKALHSYSFPLKKLNSELRFDVIPADQKLADVDDSELRHRFTRSRLYKRLETARQKYDYILIDAPPNWRLISQMAVYAADVVLIPTKHNSLFSLENAATVMKKFIPEVQSKKANGSPIPLPIFFNGERITEPQLDVARKEIDNILKTAKKEGFTLWPYFYPKSKNAQKNPHIHQVPSYANIASAAFSRVPAVYRDRSAHEYYKDLAKEYFLP